jgi:MFS family permease
VICTQSVGALQALVLGILVVTNLVQLWQIYLLALLLGIVNAFDNPTRQAFVAELVGRERLQNAVALNSMLFNAARVVGPAVAGIVISAVGIGQAFLVNAISFLPVLIGLALMRPGEFHALPHPVRDKVFRQLRAGIRYAVGTPDVALTLILVGILGTFGYNFSTVLPLLARYTLHAGAMGLGLLTSAVGIGSVIAALGVASARRTSLAVIFGAAAAFSVVLALVGISTWLPLTLALLVSLGIASIAFSSSANTRLQMSAPDELRGRVMSLYFLLFAGTTPIGGFLVGELAARAGVQPTVVVLGATCLLGVAGTALYSRRRAAHPAAGNSIPSPRAATPGGTPAVR